MTVSAGKKISIHYVLKIEDKVVDSNVGAEPLVYTQGEKQIVPGLEKCLEGMAVGESKNVTVSPEEGYGPVEAKAIIEVPKEQIPAEAQAIGSTLQSQTPEGQVLQSTVVELKEDIIVLDFNHPLAGKTLEFEVEIAKVE
ncbi:UNVERIFIED_CONTAM: hypothetical protein GTU68_005837 [Idotea baltica]|nr:hypothetical protein [Idotea baltica]